MLIKLFFNKIYQYLEYIRKCESINFVTSIFFKVKIELMNEKKIESKVYYNQHVNICILICTKLKKNMLSTSMFSSVMLDYIIHVIDIIYLPRNLYMYIHIYITSYTDI